MRTSLNDIKTIEQYIAGAMPANEALVFEARMISNPGFQHDVAAQRLLHRLVRFFARKKMKASLNTTFAEKLSDERFQHTVSTIFNSN